MWDHFHLSVCGGIDRFVPTRIVRKRMKLNLPRHLKSLITKKKKSYSQAINGLISFKEYKKLRNKCNAECRKFHQRKNDFILLSNDRKLFYNHMKMLSNPVSIPQIRDGETLLLDEEAAERFGSFFVSTFEKH